MNKTMMYLMADLHRTINNGGSSLTISVLDLKELLSAVESAGAREQHEKCGVVFGFVGAETLKNMRSGRALYLTIRRKKNDEYCEPVYCDPINQKPVDATAQPIEDSATT